MSETEDYNNDFEPPKLSADTMKVLLEFYKEQEERENKMMQIAEGNVPDYFEEDWNMSQFWYTQDTAKALAEECLRQANGGEIACISCPTLYMMLQKLDPAHTGKLFEYDTRFSVFKDDFIFFDYRNPLCIPRDIRERFSVVVADPPYLSDDCLTKTAITVKFVAKSDAKIILCSGAIIEDLAERLLKTKRCRFCIRHKNRLSNSFVCYANYNLDDSCKEH